MMRTQMNADFQDPIRTKMFFGFYPGKSASPETKKILIIS